MKDTLKRIKRGEIQLFIPIAKQYLDDVYTCVLQSYNEEQAITITKNIVSKLYEDIVNKYRWQDPEKFIGKSLMNSCHKNKVNWGSNEWAVIQAPPQVERMLFADLSRNFKRKGYRNIIISRGVALGFIAVLCLALIIFSRNSATPNEGDTIYKAFVKPKIIYEESTSVNYAMSIKRFKIDSICQLGTEGMAITYISPENEHFIRLFQQGKLVNTIDIKRDFSLVCGDFENDYLILASPTRIEKINLQGDLLTALEKPNSILGLSSNNQYCILMHLNDTHSYEIIDFNTFTSVSEGDFSEGFVGVNNSGIAVFDNRDIYRKLNKDYQIVNTKILEDDTLITIFRDGTVLRHDSDNIFWEKRIDLSRVFDDPDNNILMADVIYSNDKITVVFENNKITAFQSFDLLHGEKLLSVEETQLSGISDGPLPIFIEDGNAFALSTSSDRYYNSIRVIETSGIPMKEILVDDNSGAEKFNIERKDNSFFVYVEESDKVMIFRLDL